ncbi:hypothetical protein KDW49_26575 [Burkholderia dolosa]|uniref:PD-(D/E)XK nuclease domain-containing protein n=1 Tax=Burkholderia dolosa TaxID=152500 RepID=UPI001B98FF26|nr:hypothetical protein [Burkholderia dolosa]MBR8304281.1 hypothetical protein [Burkholderia dolosa]
MTLTAEKLQPALDYLQRFFNAHHHEHRLMMREAGGALYGPGREPYEGYNEAIDYLRDAVLLPEDTFDDLRIPEGFPTPQSFLHAATGFSNMLDSHATRVTELNALQGGNWPTVLSYAYKICTKTRDAINHALELADVSVEAPPLKRLTKLLERLPTVSRVIAKENRRESRPTLEIMDEYDVQDLLYGVLHLDFDDIRPEVWCPNYAGTNTRTDFLLPAEGIIIEAKHTKNAKAQTTITEELIIDIARYKPYPGVKHMVCAIWDTGYHLKNPVGLKADLERHNAGFVTVVVMK